MSTNDSDFDDDDGGSVDIGDGLEDILDDRESEQQGDPADE